VVLPDGYVIGFGGSTVKNCTGYDLVPLFTGSEGTLGIITKIILRLIPKPAARKTIMAIFDHMTVAGSVVSRILASGIVPAKVEFVDNFVIRRIEEKMQIGLPVEANTMLLIDVDGSPASVETEAQQILEFLKSGGAQIARLAKDENEATTYWKARSAGFAAIYGTARTIGMRFPYGFVFRHLLSNRKLFGNVLWLSSLAQSAFMPKTNGIIRHLPNFLSALSKGPQIPSIAPKFLRQQVMSLVEILG
jgi:FAD/FMN-containing dehydrogenase